MNSAQTIFHIVHMLDGNNNIIILLPINHVSFKYARADKFQHKDGRASINFNFLLFFTLNSLQCNILVYGKLKDMHIYNLNDGYITWDWHYMWCCSTYYLLLYPIHPSISMFLFFSSLFNLKCCLLTFLLLPFYLYSFFMHNIIIHI